MFSNLRLSNEQITEALIILGIPVIFWLYFDWKAALASLIIVNIILGVLRELDKARRS